MLMHEELRFYVEKLYPDIEHGTHYWVGHPIDRETRAQIGPAKIVHWSYTEAQPTDVQIAELAAEYKQQAIEHCSAQAAREERFALLAEADRMVEQAKDVGNVERERVARQYRQALRDITQQEGFPLDFEWPVMPG